MYVLCQLQPVMAGSARRFNDGGATVSQEIIVSVYIGSHNQ